MPKITIPSKRLRRASIQRRGENSIQSYGYRLVTMALVMAMLLSSVVLLAFGRNLPSASAATKETIKTQGYYGGAGGFIGFKCSNGGVGFCVNPKRGDVAWATFNSWDWAGEAKDIPCNNHSLAYLAYLIGPPSDNRMKFANYTSATMTAFWLLNGASVNWSAGTYNTGSMSGHIYSGFGNRINRSDVGKIQDAVKQAKAHSGKAGIWDRAGRVWYCTNKSNQNIIEMFPLGNIKITKASAKTSLTTGNSAYKLSGAKFGIFTDSKCKNRLATLTTDVSGTATLSKVPVGTYYVKEETAPTNYKIDSSKAVTLVVKKGGTATHKFTDTPDTAIVQITKESSNKSIPAKGDYSLEGAVYGIWEGRYSITNGADGKAGTKDDVLWGKASDLSGVYEITSANDHGFAIDLKGGADAANTPIQLYAQATSQNQRWYVQKATGYGSSSYWISNVKTGLRMAPKSAAAKDVNIVTKKANDKDANQVWDIVKSSYSGHYIIKNHAKTSLVLDIPSGKMENSNQLKLWASNGTKSQSWKLRKTYIGKATTDKNGVMKFTGLVPNTTYYVRELSGPTAGGYKMNYSVIEIKTGKANSTVKATTKETPVPKTPTVSIGTTATVNDKKSIVRPGSGNVTIKDVVSYTFTVPVGAKRPTTQFTLTGTLMDKSTKKAFQVGGKSATSTATFTPTADKGTCEMTFTVPASAITKTTDLVVYEELTGRMSSADAADKVVATHKVITDAGQTVTIEMPNSPTLKIGTTATVNGKKSIVVPADAESMTIKDVVSYTFTVPTGTTLPTGTFTVTGTLMDKATKQPFKVDGQAVTATGSFTPTSNTGTCEMEFTIPTASISETTDLVVYEKVRGIMAAGEKEDEVAKHENINDSGQTVKITTTDKPNISIRTVATVDGKHEAMVSEESTVRITDKVHYEFDLNDNPLPTRPFRVSGILMDKATGEQLKNGDDEIIAETSFTPDAETGEVDVVFEVPAEVVHGKHVVVFERVYDSLAEGLDATAEDDLENQDQTVSFPSIGTTATDDITEGHEATVALGATRVINDEVAYTGLVPNQEYVMTGTLMDKATGEPVDGVEPVNVPFVPTTQNGTVLVEFTVPTSSLIGKTVVAFESLSHDGTEVAAHADINDEGQSVTYHEQEGPSISTTAKDSMTESNLGSPVGDVTIIDSVSYQNLVPETRYVVRGILMDKATGKPLAVGATGEETVVASTAFIPGTGNGFIDLEFPVSGEYVEGKSVVVFESLYADGDDETPVATHEDINDEGQTVTYAGIGTTAVDAKTGTHYGSLSEDTVTINDTVHYQGLAINKTYTLKGTLMDKGSEEPLLVNENEVVVSQEFTPTESAGDVVVTFTLPRDVVVGKALVVFETLFDGETQIADHAEIDDDGQTVSYPEIGTTAVDAMTSSHIGATGVDTVTVSDSVRYNGLVPGQVYTITGTLMDKATGEPLKKDGTPVTATTEFVPDAAIGSITVEFSVPWEVIGGHTVVAFESVSQNEKEIAVHADIEDEEQTVRYPRIGTTAYYEANGSKDAPSRTGTLVIVDKVEYAGLVPGKKYIMRGSLHDKDVDVISMGDRQNYESAKTDFLTEEEGSASVEFTPSESDGFVEIRFNVPAEKAQARDIVAFERLSLIENDEETLIATHEDLNDEGQTVHGPVPVAEEAQDVVKTSKETSKGNLLATGFEIDWMAGAVALGAFAAFLVVVAMKRHHAGK